jgi:hypothetical protein
MKHKILIVAIILIIGVIVIHKFCPSCQAKMKMMLGKKSDDSEA